MEILNISNLNALFALVIAYLTFSKIPKKRKELLLLFASIGVFICSLGSTYVDTGDKKKLNNNIDSLQNEVSGSRYRIDTLLKNSETSNRYLSFINQYISNLDSIGIKRDSVTNKPIITKQFVNHINYVKELNQY